MSVKRWFDICMEYVHVMKWNLIYESDLVVQIFILLCTFSLVLLLTADAEKKIVIMHRKFQELST